VAVAKREIKRIGVFSAVKTLFILGGFGGFVVGIIQWAFLGIMLYGARQSGWGAGELIPGLDQIFDTGIGVLGFVLPVFGAIMGAMFGVLYGFLFAGAYNVAARLWGGLEIEVTETVVPRPIAPAAVRPQHTGPTPLPGSAPQPTDTPRRDDATERPPPPPPSFE